jgi:hypothetical protein
MSGSKINNTIICPVRERADSAHPGGVTLLSKPVPLIGANWGGLGGAKKPSPTQHPAVRLFVLVGAWCVLSLDRL